MSLSGALTELVAIREGLTITSPVQRGIKRVWKFWPPQNVNLPEHPAWVTTWDFSGQERLSKETWRRTYTVRMQLAAQDAMVEMDRGMEVATAFWEVLLPVMGADKTLNGAVVNSRLVGTSPTLARVEIGGKAYIGLNIEMELELWEVA